MDEPVNILIKYEGPATDRGVDFAVLGSSFVGFDQLLKDLFDISKVNGSIEVRTQRIDKGSVKDCVDLYITLNGLPFNNPVHLYEFLRIAAPELVARAQELVSTARSVDDGLNAFFAERPLDSMLLVGFITKTLEWSGVTGRIQRRMNSLRKYGRFKRAVAPLQETGYDKITVSQRNVADGPIATISDTDLPDYLPAEDKILPSLQDGAVIVLNAKVVGLNSQRGERVTLRIAGLDEYSTDYLAHPPEGEDASVFKDYYGLDVAVTAEVIRKNNNLYKKPEFRINNMDTRQTSLQLFDDDETGYIGSTELAE